MKVLAPVALFAYKRLDHLKKTLDSLRANHLAAHADLHIYCDGPRTEANRQEVAAVRHYVKGIDGFRSVRLVMRDQNLGLAASIIAGVTELLSNQGRVIVLEDDMETSPWFLEYMNDMLDLYEGESAVASIHGYALPAADLPDYYFVRGADCWGWATWTDRWQRFEPDSVVLLRRLREQKQLAAFNSYGFRPLYLLTKQAMGEIDSWYIRWHASTFLGGKLTLHPGRSFIRNIGTDGSGTHGDTATSFDSQLIGSYQRPELIHVSENVAVINKVNAWYARSPKERLRSLAKLLLSYLKYFQLRLQGRA